MFSGKQVLMSLLTEYSQKFQEDDKLGDISENIRSAFLLHGSTPNHMWYAVDNIEWESYLNHDDEISQQGIGIKKLGILLSDFFLEILSDEKVEKLVQDKFPELSKVEVESNLWLIFSLLRLLEWSRNDMILEQNEFENSKEIPRSIDSMKKKLELFRKDPDEYLGLK